MGGLAAQTNPAARLASPEGYRERSGAVLEVLLALPSAETVVWHLLVQSLAQTRVQQTMTAQASVKAQVMIP